MVTLGRLLTHVGWTLACPGAGQGAAGRRGWMIAWAAAGLVAVGAFTVTVWALYVAIGVHVASAVDAAVRLRRVEREDKMLPLYASLVGVAAFVYFQFATDRYAIPSDSMLPTIAPGDTVYVRTFATTPARGDVIVFTHPCEGIPHIKRVVALAGDTVEVRCGLVHVNGKPLPTTADFHETNDGHTYATRPGATAKDFPRLDRVMPSCRGSRPSGDIVATPSDDPCTPQLHMTVPAGSVFVLGDNRAVANDSRVYGVVPTDAILGVAIGVAWPPSHVGAVH